jgi:protease IV
MAKKLSQKEIQQLLQQPSKSWGFILTVLVILALASVVIAGMVGNASGTSGAGNVAVIKVHGAIVVGSDGIFAKKMAFSDDVVKFIDKAAKDKSVQAILLDINSPGGSAVASDEVVQALQDANKTTVALIRDVGASGAYWIASSADHVIAHKASLTGSIGVIASYLEWDGFLDDHNVTYRRLTAGRLKDMGSPFKEMTPEEQRLFQGTLNELHGVFIQHVAEGRDMSEEEVRKLATGQFFSGLKAKELGLVDELGGRREAKAYLKKELEVKDVKFVAYKKPKTFVENIMGALSEQSFEVGRGMGSMLFSDESVVKV